MSTIVRTSQPTFYDEQYDLERPWIGTVAVTTLFAVTIIGIISGALLTGSAAMVTSLFVLFALFTGTLLIAFTAYRTWTDSRTVTVDGDGLHYRYARNNWEHIPLENIRGWQVKRQRFFWLKNDNEYLETLIIHLNRPLNGKHGDSDDYKRSIRTKQAFEVGQSIDRAKTNNSASLEPVPSHVGTIVMDRESAMIQFASDFCYKEKSRPRSI